MPPSRMLLTPTRQQTAIVGCDKRLLIVEANAGAAKTTTLMLRIERALSEGIPPSRILALTYTDAGREALVTSFRGSGVPSEVARQIRIRTFDDFATTQLRAFQGETSRPRTPERVRPYVLEAIKFAREAQQGRHANEFHISGHGDMAVEGLLHAFRQVKGGMLRENISNEFILTPVSANEVIGWDYTTLATLRAYENLRAGDVRRDTDVPLFRYLDDATYDLAKMLLSDGNPFDDDSHPLALNLRLIAVDEMHDMNRAMFTVLRGLLDRNPKAAFIGVGDSDQVIHSEAAADSYFMRHGFDSEAGKATRLPLSASYRFGPAVAQLLSYHANKQYSARADRDTRIELLTAVSPKDVCRVIQKALTKNQSLRSKSLLGELAVLLRHPSRFVQLENELLDGGVNYVTYGFESYLRRPEVLFMRAVLCCALGMIDSVESVEIRRQMIYSFMLFAGVSIRNSMDGASDKLVNQEWETIAKLTTGNHFAEQTLPAILDRMPRQARDRISAAMLIVSRDRVEELAQAIDVLDVEWFASRVLVYSTDVDAARDSVQGLVTAAKDFDSISSLMRGTGQRELILDQMKRKRTGIRLSTIEAAKGLEFDHVIMPDVNAGEFDDPRSDDQNLFYVGASRARHLLTLMFKAEQPSRFLKPMLCRHETHRAVSKLKCNTRQRH